MFNKATNQTVTQFLRYNCVFACVNEIAFKVEQKEKCSAWVITFDNITVSVRQFQVYYLEVQRPIFINYKVVKLVVENWERKEKVCTSQVVTGRYRHIQVAEKFSLPQTSSLSLSNQYDSLCPTCTKTTNSPSAVCLN